MESIWKEKTRPRTMSTSVVDRVKKLEEKAKIRDRGEETKKKMKQFKWPLKWRKSFNKSTKKNAREKLLVIFLNKKNEIEPPKFMPIFDGNMVVWKDKPYEFDPRAMWTILGVRKNPRAYLIKEIDRRPVKNKFDKYIYSDAAVSNMDLDEVRDRGDSTESDAFLIKAALKAQTSQISKKKMSAIAMIIMLAIVGGVLWIIFGGGA